MRFKRSKTIKALGLRSRAFISFLVFETPMKKSHSFLKYYVEVGSSANTCEFTSSAYFKNCSIDINASKQIIQMWMKVRKVIYIRIAQWVFDILKLPLSINKACQFMLGGVINI